MALIPSILSAIKRIEIETKNSSVELVMDSQDIDKLSLREGISKENLLLKLKDAGITSIALTEDTLENLELNGKILWLTNYEQKNLLKMSKRNAQGIKKTSDKARRTVSPSLKSLERNSKPNIHFSYAIADDPIEAQRIEKELSIVLGTGQVSTVDNNTIQIIDDEEDLMGLGVGIRPEEFSYYISRGFNVVPRLKNNYRLNGQILDNKLASLKSSGPFLTVVFDGEEVLGYKNNIQSIGAAIKKNSINYGYIEMAEQKGDSELLKSMKANIARVHSISEDEMQKKMTKRQALERFERAVAERGVRMLYIRPFYMTEKGMNLVETNVAYIAAIKTKLQKNSFSIGKADVPAEFSQKASVVILINLAIASALLLLIGTFVDLNIFAVGLTFILFAALPGILTALICASIFPCLAVVYAFP